MGISKNDEFSVDQNRYAKMFKALAHPARIAIVERLLTQESCECGSIVDQLPLAQSTVSQHLKELKNAGLIQGSTEGTSVCYCINAMELKKLQDYVGKMESKIKQRCC